MNPVLASIMFSIGITLLLIGYAPVPISPNFGNQVKARNFRDRFRKSLQLAGVFDQAPIVVMIGLGALTFALMIFVGVLTGKLLAALAMIPVVPAAAHYVLMARQRAFIHRATDEIVPFLNRIATSVKSGNPVPTAYVKAVQEARELKDILAPSAAKITGGERFSTAIIETIDALPLRMWSVFVRQVEAFDDSGGNLAEGLEKTIKQVNIMLQLSSEARADYAAQANQQRIIVLVVAAGILFFTLSINTELMSVLWTTVPGVIGACISFAVMGFGLWYSRKQLKDIEKRLNF